VNTFRYLNKIFHCEDVSIEALARAVGTPTYIYSQKEISSRCQELIHGFSSYPTLICYAVKANSNLSILREIARHGIGADLVSVGELERALTVGINPQRIVFSGVGKTPFEMERALRAGILFFNVESTFELESLSQVARSLGVRAPVSLRINPNIDAKTNAKIATGLYTTKFGLPEQDLPFLADLIARDPHLELVGIACHIGSQIVELAPLEKASQRMADLATALINRGHSLKYLDLGGGLGIRYHEENPPSVQAYAQTLIAAAQKTGLTLVIEPGRSIIGNAGILLTRVIGIKRTPDREFVVIDAAMNDLIRPTLYEAYHDIVPIVGPWDETATTLCDFVGPVCETGDYIAKNRYFAPCQAGDLLAIRSCGAYGWSMASQYNSRPRPAEILVSEAVWSTIRPRESLDSLWESELQALSSVGTNSVLGLS
jgi:diaminopimelate decarboxylase